MWIQVSSNYDPQGEGHIGGLIFIYKQYLKYLCKNQLVRIPDTCMEAPLDRVYTSLFKS